MPSIDAGSDIDNGTVTTLLFSLAGGLIALITLVFSLLFLVVPYANTSLSPRLTLFRDDPVVWRSFAYFVAVFVFLTVSGLSLSDDSEVSVLRRGHRPAARARRRRRCSQRAVRLLLKVPTWDDYLAIGIDELMPYVGSAPLARRRLVEMIDDLVAEAPPPRRAALEARQLELGLPSALTDRTMT